MGELSEIAARLYEGDDISNAKIRDYADAMAREFQSIGFHVTEALKDGDPELTKPSPPLKLKNP